MSTHTQVHHPSGSHVTIYHFGATLTSFVDAHGRECLFLSEKAVLDGSKPIRGGIPIVFPQFGSGPLTKHGFARCAIWREQEHTFLPLEENATSQWMQVIFKLDFNDCKVDGWDYKYDLTYIVRFNESSLQTTLEIRNLGDEDFEFQALLHTYHTIQEVTGLCIRGVKKNDAHINQLQDATEDVFRDGGNLTINKEVDRIYIGIENNDKRFVLDEGRDSPSASIGTLLTLNGEAVSHDVVVWNPWVDKAKQLGDFGHEEYHKMLCIEPGCVNAHKRSTPGSVWRLAQHLAFSTPVK